MKTSKILVLLLSFFLVSSACQAAITIVKGVTAVASSSSGGSVAGSDTQVQYNNAGAFGGATNLTIDAGGNANLGSYTTTTPSAPSTGVTLFARNRAGVVHPAFINGTDTWADFQRALYRGNFSYLNVKGGGSSQLASAFGSFANSTASSATAATIGTTSYLTELQRLNYNTTASAGTEGKLALSNGSTSGPMFRGNAAGRGGFFFVTRFGIETHQSGQRFFAGIYPSSTSFAAQDPSSVASVFGIGMDAGDTNLSFISNDSSSGKTKTALGANFPGLTDGATYELRIYAKPNDTVVYYSLERLDVAQFTEGNEPTNLFPNTSFQNVGLSIANGATAAIASMAFISAYLELPN